ncbi:MAG TPA: GAF domain-containing sensor histidine kinase [Terriglobales bacterium]|jgi:signal transduction histidine kinase|nr:GAF domain-containing sensor histidine kinase [Terriglobales bacterium]
MSATLPDSERQRLKALADEHLLDTLPEKNFDNLTRLAAFICGTPISLISLVDESRQWFKSRIGTEVEETPRDMAFCAHTILSTGELTVVPDATKDRRFASNPLVTDDPNIRFYAGAPLVTREGFALGSLCVIDRVPRMLTSQQLEALAILRDQVVREIELRRVAGGLQNAVRDRNDELGERNEEILQQAKILQSLTTRLMTAQDEERRRIARELHDSAGQLLVAASLNVEIVMNGLSTSSPVREAAECCRDLLRQLTAEVRTMSYLLHPPLLDESGLLSALTLYVQGIQDRSPLQVDLEIPEDLPRMNSRLELVLFRVIQECLTNIHRHSGSKTARIRLSPQSHMLLLQIEDDGKGIPPHRLHSINSQGSGVGMQGMRERVRQMGGHMNIHSDGLGTRVEFILPLTLAGENDEFEIKSRRRAPAEPDF